MELKGICKYCLGCNKLEDCNYEGINRCKNFATGIDGWQERYRKELEENENTSDRPTEM